MLYVSAASQAVGPRPSAWRCRHTPGLWKPGVTLPTSRRIRWCLDARRALQTEGSRPRGPAATGCKVVAEYACAVWQWSCGVHPMWAHLRKVEVARWTFCAGPRGPHLLHERAAPCAARDLPCCAVACCRAQGRPRAPWARSPTAISRMAERTACVSACSSGSAQPATTCRRPRSDCEAGLPPPRGCAPWHWLSESSASHSRSDSFAGRSDSAGTMAATARKVQKRPLAMVRGAMRTKATWCITSIPALVMPREFTQSRVAVLIPRVRMSKRLHSTPSHMCTEGEVTLQSRALMTALSCLAMCSSSTQWAPLVKPMPASHCAYCVARFARAATLMTLLLLSTFFTMTAIATQSSGRLPMWSAADPLLLEQYRSKRSTVSSQPFCLMWSVSASA
mmetsp:Transcript_70196/g.205827  ORF Transcript_70196/g.205827 Transcript_70196/m.205827 type:complete len:393 (+) Transcript_70196:5-1183(+)